MSSNIFAVIDKIKLSLSPEQIAELCKFNPTVIEYINSCSQSFITYEIFHSQCKQYSAKKDLSVDLELRDRVLNAVKKRESRHHDITRNDYFESYNKLFDDTVKDDRDV